MKLIIRHSANKDVKKLPKAIKEEIEKIVLRMVEAESLGGLNNIKKMKGHGSAYRMRIKDYRLGFFLEEDTIIASRILHRKDIYQYFH